ncbi:hypothetical protein ABDK00_002980 [Niabella insulamsoli]|uniref:hypothetical protein n=1 Tax=Niabella insulamsoli TaxID=3144874 RepID=UPI0031FC1E6F
MKKFTIVALVLVGFAFSQQAAAQVRVNINIGNQPGWGPVGYNYARYYYLPEANAYYDVNAARFMYLQRGRWVTSRYLPSAYRGVNLYNTYKVVVNRSYAPYRDNRSDWMRYGKYRSFHNQSIIRDSRDYRYYESRYHPKHKEWKGNRYDKYDRDRHRKDHDRRDRDRRDRDRGRR